MRTEELFRDKIDADGLLAMIKYDRSEIQRRKKILIRNFNLKNGDEVIYLGNRAIIRHCGFLHDRFFIGLEIVWSGKLCKARDPEDITLGWGREGGLL